MTFKAIFQVNHFESSLTGSDTTFLSNTSLKEQSYITIIYGRLYSYSQPSQ